MLLCPPHLHDLHLGVFLVGHVTLLFEAIPGNLTLSCVSPQGDLEPVYKAALGLGTANQLTNILRDVGEDVNERNRVYIPLDELREFGIPEQAVRSCAAHLAANLNNRFEGFCKVLKSDESQECATFQQSSAVSSVFCRLLWQ